MNRETRQQNEARENEEMMKKWMKRGRMGKKRIGLKALKKDRKGGKKEK